jgi:hypothetical protein
VPLKRSDDVSHTRPPARPGDVGIDEDRQRWPDVQHHRTSVRAKELEVQPTRRSKHDMSPLSAYIHQCVSCVFVASSIDVGLEYFQKGIVRDGADCNSWGASHCPTQFSSSFESLGENYHPLGISSNVASLPTRRRATAATRFLLLKPFIVGICDERLWCENN